MMIQSILALFVWIFVLPQVSSYHYFIHSSCENEAVLTPAIAEVISMAQITHARLLTLLRSKRSNPSSEAERYGRRVLNQMFTASIQDTIVTDKIIGNPRSHTCFCKVPTNIKHLGMTEYLRGLTLTTDQFKATVRFYCDNDISDRYKMVPDTEPENLRHSGPPKNSERPDEKKEFNDVENGIRHIGTIRGCQKKINGATARAYTVQETNLLYGPFTDMITPRAVITVSRASILKYGANIRVAQFCTGGISGEVDRQTTVRGVQNDHRINIDGFHVVTYKRLPTMIVLHEVCLFSFSNILSKNLLPFPF